MSTPSIKVGQGNWGIKAGNLLAYANTEKKFAPIEFTSSRALDTATRVNASGNIEIVNANIPRIDYFGGQASLLVEPSAQNLAFNSQVWDQNNNWRTTAAGNYSVVINTTGTTAPDGTQTANAFSPTSGNTTHFTVSNQTTTISFASGTIYTQSAFFKKGTGVAGRYVQLTFTGPGIFSQLGYANYDLELGSVAVVSGTSADTNRNARIENYGNGWYRCIFTATCPTSGLTGSGVNFYLITSSGSTRAPSFSGTTSDIVYAWGAQVETGSVATSYIPTTTGAVTRNADVISLTGVAGLIGQTEGTIYAEFINTFSSSYNDGVLIRVFSDANNEVFGRKEAASNRYTFRWRANSQNTTFTSVNVPDGVNKVAIAYKSGDTALFLNGVQIGSTSTDVRAFSVNPTTVALGSNGGAGQFFNDRIRAASIYQTRLPNTTTDGSPSLQSITTL